ncbi:hypothetical protein [Sphingomonas colocasiae]|uniref:Uncharacterized protein n=1 Tax=Sphingomonas colocasiae TaxID=1848973 RepID=A0ABS7PN42_9SPHN|nr:hypothetical protein [Sphingomonas colocasiae]MBY8821867.1 hypothetical protein [Sphingomonas colocasiae]
MTRRKLVFALIITALYALAIWARLWANALVHPAADGDMTSFMAEARWRSLRDLTILTGVYGSCILALILYRRKG